MVEERYLALNAGAGGASMDLSRLASAVSLESALGRPAALTVRLPDPHGLLAHALQEGVALTLALGTPAAHPVVFRGAVHNLALELPEQGAPSLTITAHDALMGLGLRRRSRSWAGRTLGALAAEIASEHRLLGAETRLEADPSYGEGGPRQREETDLALLLRLTEAETATIRLLPGEAGETLELVSLATLWRAEPSLTLVYGRTGAARPLSAFSARSWTAAVERDRVYGGVLGPSGEAIAVVAPLEERAEVEDPFLVEALARLGLEEPKRVPALERAMVGAPLERAALRGRIRGAEAEDLPGLQDSLSGVVARATNRTRPRGEGMEATGRAPFETPMEPGQVIRVLGAGGRFSGDWLVTRVQRALGAGRASLDFSCVR